MKSDTENFESDQKNIPLKGRVKAYFWINILLGGFGLGIAILAGWDLCVHPKDSEGVWASAGIIALSLIGFIIFLTRATWIKLVNNRGFRVTNSPDDYALERTTLFAWGLLLTVSVIAQGIDGASGVDTILKWIIALAYWTPIVSTVGSSWGKLKATHSKGDKAVWPLSWGR